jgi:hypothetical protein
MLALLMSLLQDVNVDDASDDDPFV